MFPKLLQTAIASRGSAALAGLGASATLVAATELATLGDRYVAAIPAIATLATGAATGFFAGSLKYYQDRLKQDTIDAMDPASAYASLYLTLFSATCFLGSTIAYGLKSFALI